MCYAMCCDLLCLIICTDLFFFNIAPTSDCYRKFSRSNSLLNFVAFFTFIDSKAKTCGSHDPHLSENVNRDIHILFHRNSYDSPRFPYA